MRKILVKNNIYSKSGSLVIARNNYIDLDKCEKVLEKLGILDEVLAEELKQESNNTENNIKKEDFINQVDIFKQKCNITDDSLLRIVGIVQNFLFNSREFDWHMYLNTLVNYVEWNYSHAINTALITGMIGVKLNYNNEDLEELVLGALLHDIGMLLIPSNICLKTEPLSTEEEGVIHKHCELGYSMIVNTSLSLVVKSIILQHHEMLDGSGYPNALKDNEITEQAKIVTVADAFDSATSYMPFKQIKNPKKALAEILENREKYLDKVVKCLIDILK